MNIRTYVRHVLVLLFGSGAAQLLNLAAYPFLTRLYSPADFGSFALFLAVVGIIGPIACARFDLIVQTAKDWQLPAVYRRALRFNALVSVVVAITAVCHAAVTGSLGFDVALLLGVGVFLSGYTLTAAALLFRLERYGTSARAMMARSTVTGIAQIGLWLAWPSPFGLILGFCAGFAAQALLLKWSLRDVRWRRSTLRHGRAVQARYRAQVLTDIPSTVLGGLVLNVMSFLVLDLYSRDEVGFYSLAFRFGVLPLALISGSLSDVFYQRASASYRGTGTFWAQLRFNVLVGAGLSLLIFVPVGLLARPLFGFAFGAEWVPAADMLVLLLPMLIVRFVSATIQTAPLVIGRANWLLYQHVGLIGVIALGYALAKAFRLPISDYLALTSVLMGAVYLCFVVLVATKVRNRFAGRAEAIGPVSSA